MTQERPEILVTLFNSIVRAADFLSAWMCARLVLIEKPKKVHESTSYRYRYNICFIDSTVEILEMILKDRLEIEFE